MGESGSASACSLSGLFQQLSSVVPPWPGSLWQYSLCVGMSVAVAALLVQRKNASATDNSIEGIAKRKFVKRQHSNSTAAQSTSELLLSSDSPISPPPPSSSSSSPSSSSPPPSRPSSSSSLSLLSASVLWKVQYYWNLIRDLSLNPYELYCFARYFLQQAPRIPDNASPNELFCYSMMKKTSRSFYAVTMELHDELRLPVLVFYLVLRALDTIEDDTTVSLEEKTKAMREFAEKSLVTPGWCCKKGIGRGLFVADAASYASSSTAASEAQLLEEFAKIQQVYADKLKPEYREAIRSITVEMVDGMTKYLHKPVDSVGDFNDYCYYVAGLVGVGLVRMIHHSGLEGNRRFAHVDDLAIAMGRFLQKTNIIRDFYEDTTQTLPRIFYPRAVWSRYVDRFVDLGLPENRPAALHCLADMIANALSHIPQILHYLSLVKEKSVFRFCAIPQLMAIGTLERLYSNEHFTRGVVKIRKGEAVSLILRCDTYQAVLDIFEDYCLRIQRKALADHNTRDGITATTKRKPRSSHPQSAKEGDDLSSHIPDIQEVLSRALEAISFWRLKADQESYHLVHYKESRDRE